MEYSFSIASHLQSQQVGPSPFSYIVKQVMYGDKMKCFMLTDKGRVLVWNLRNSEVRYLVSRKAKKENQSYVQVMWTIGSDFTCMDWNVHTNILLLGNTLGEVHINLDGKDEHVRMRNQKRMIKEVNHCKLSPNSRKFLSVVGCKMFEWQLNE